MYCLATSSTSSLLAKKFGETVELCQTEESIERGSRLLLASRPRSCRPYVELEREFRRSLKISLESRLFSSAAACIQGSEEKPYQNKIWKVRSFTLEGITKIYGDQGTLSRKMKSNTSSLLIRSVNQSIDWSVEPVWANHHFFQIKRIFFVTSGPSTGSLSFEWVAGASFNLLQTQFPETIEASHREGVLGGFHRFTRRRSLHVSLCKKMTQEKNGNRKLTLPKTFLPVDEFQIQRTSHPAAW